MFVGLPKSNAGCGLRHLGEIGQGNRLRPTWFHGKEVSWINATRAATSRRQVVPRESASTHRGIKHEGGCLG